MTVFGLTDAPATSSGRAQLRLVHAGAAEAEAGSAPRPASPPAAPAVVKNWVVSAR